MADLSSFSQVQIPNLPIGGIVSGYNNIINNGISVIVGSGNKITTAFSFINGINNTIKGKNGYNNILGSNNYSQGNYNLSVGDSNTISGTNLSVNGYTNTISGAEQIKIFGSTNSVIGIFSKILKVNINGDSNQVSGNSIDVKGNNNIIEVGVNNSSVQGDNNFLHGGYTYFDLTSYTASAPTFSTDPILSNSTGIYLQGNNNIIGTSSTNVYLSGDNNYIAPYTTNVYAIGSNLTITQSGSYIIGVTGKGSETRNVGQTSDGSVNMNGDGVQYVDIDGTDAGIKYDTISGSQSGIVYDNITGSQSGISYQNISGLTQGVHYTDTVQNVTFDCPVNFNGPVTGLTVPQSVIPLYTMAGTYSRTLGSGTFFTFNFNQLTDIGDRLNFSIGGNVGMPTGTSQQYITINIYGTASELLSLQPAFFNSTVGITGDGSTFYSTGVITRVNSNYMSFATSCVAGQLHSAYDVGSYGKPGYLSSNGISTMTFSTNMSIEIIGGATLGYITLTDASFYLIKNN